MNKATIAAVVAGSVLIGMLIRFNACQGDDGWPPHDGQLRQTVSLEAGGLRRGGAGTVTLTATAHYTRKDADRADQVTIARFERLDLSLVDGAGRAVPLTMKKVTAAGGHTTAEVTLPEVSDGDYRLSASYQTRLGPGELAVPLPLYTPARVHVITDRPLYEPGNLVRFRAVVLRARDLAPLDGRPGSWKVKDPDGEVVLEEKAPAGEWGVVAGTFPLDKGAATGTWTVVWESADASDAVPFTVEPFTLPRFRVEATADKAYYRPLETPVVRGTVTYSSGAPVPGADVALTWRVDGDWPPPTEWLQTLLPQSAKSGANGRFELTLPQIPSDLQGRATLVARLSAVDPAGDRVEGSLAVLLSQDGLQVSSVTEVGDGLVQGFNNRVYLRVTTPDGAVVRGAKINVKRAWQGDDQGIDAELDEDGVASLQLDPGPPVNVVIPAPPYRPASRPPLVTRDEPEELIGQDGAPLADQLEMDRWLAALAPCAVWHGDDDDEVGVALRAGAGGGLTVAVDGATPLARCVATTLRGRRLPSGKARMYSVTFSFTDPGLPTLSASIESAFEQPEGLSEGLAELAMGARACLPRDVEGDLPRILTWSVRAGEKVVRLGDWVDDPEGGDAAGALPCAMARLRGTVGPFEEAFTADAMGVARFAVELPGHADESRPQPTTMLGYELLVTADVEGRPSTRLRIGPGQVPDLRLRVTPVLARAGDTVTAELIRGPAFAQSGLTLPKKLVLEHLKGKLEAELDDSRKATFTITPGTEGWCEITGGGARALVYVRPEADLTVTVMPGKARYAPGEQAQLALETQVGGRGAQAAVGLIGVDESLGQLVTLPGAGDLARLRPQVETTAPAFGTLDGQALTLGRIRGANAAAATVLRVGAIPRPPQLDAVVATSGETHFDPLEELTDHFYNVLAELHVQVRAWEANAPATEQMRPAKMAHLWQQAIAACERRGEPVVDAFGRRLRLHRLPPDLLALTDPRAVVVVGTRLPEDVDDWAAHVAKEQP